MSVQEADEGVLALESGRWHAHVAPHGAALRRLWVEQDGARRDIVWGYDAARDKQGGQGDVLLPWPGRIAGGRYTALGGRHELPRTDKAGPNAIHGFARNRRWALDEASPPSAAFALAIGASDHPGYPFPLEAYVRYTVSNAGLTCTCRVRNVGTVPAPVGFGFHPYLLPKARLDEAVLQVTAGELVERGDDLLPTGRRVDVAATARDFRRARAVGGVALDHTFTGLARGANGAAEVALDDVVLWFDASFPFVQLFTGDTLGAAARGALAVEPMTCGPDAFNRPEMGRTMLAPDETLQGTWGIRLRPEEPAAP